MISREEYHDSLSILFHIEIQWYLSSSIFMGNEKHELPLSCESWNSIINSSTNS